MNHQTSTNSARFTLREIVEICGGRSVYLPHGSSGETVVDGIASDTRSLPPGALFVALRGERFDGHAFLEQAAAAGGMAVLVEEPGEASHGLPLISVENTLHALGALATAHRRRFEIPLVAVTGSYGKTTTRTLIAAALSAKLVVLASPGNFNNEIGVPQTLLQLNSSHGAAVVEMGMRGAGQIDYLAQLAGPTIGVITNIGPQHIELLGGLEQIARAKAELLRALPADGVAVLPADDPFLPLLREQSPCRVVTFGEAETADYRVANLQTSEGGNVSFDLIQNSGLKIQNSTLPLPGAHNARNAAAALAVADVLGVPLPDAARALENAEVPGARMRIVEANGLTIIDDCYNAGPTSMSAALQTLHDFPGTGRRVAILGAMKELGDWAPAEHRKIGAQATTVVEALLGVGEETRDLLDAASSVAHKRWCAEAATAAAAARQLVREGDIVLVKGSRSVGLETVVSALAGS